MFEKEPMATYIVSQICFDADVIRTWIQHVRERGTSLPVWIGVPARWSSASCSAPRCGSGWGSRSASCAGSAAARRFLRPRTYTPTELLVALGPPFADPAAKVGGVHVYTFNEIEKTETWRRQLVDRLTNQKEAPWHR